MKKSFVWIFVVSIAMVFAAVSGSFAAEAKDTPAQKPKIADVGDMSPEFSLPDLAGKMVGPKDMVGKKVSVLIFMTTACSACQGEIGAVDQMLGKYGDTAQLFAVAVDVRGESTVKPFSETYKYKATYLLDPKFTVPRIFGFNYTPSVVMLDKTGKILFKKGGYSVGDEELIQEKLASFAK